MATYNTLARSQLFRSGNVELSDLGISDGTTGQGLGLNDSGNVAFIDLLGVNEYDSINLLPLSSVNEGSLALVNSTNTLYLYSSGWYKIALINNNPAITGGYSSAYDLAQDGTPLEITIIANDPEGIPLTWSYEVTSGSLTNNGGTTATVSNVDNVFTITPTTNSLYAGVFSLTFKASDGINISGVVSEFTLVFKIANSNKTSLLVKGGSFSAVSGNATTNITYGMSRVYVGTALTITSGTAWQSYTSTLPTFLQGAWGTTNINGNSSDNNTIIVTGTVRVWLLRDPTWNAVPLTGFTLYDDTLSGVITGYGTVYLYYQDVTDSTITVGDYSAMYFITSTDNNKDAVSYNGMSTFNNTLADTSTNNHTITPYGNIAQGTFSPYNSEKFSTYFDGATSYLNIANTNTVLSTGLGDFTIEAFVHGSSNGTIISNCDGGSDRKYYRLILDAGKTFTFTIRNDADDGGDYTGNTTVLTSTTTVSSSAWHHICITRSNGLISMYINGAFESSMAMNKNLTARATIIGGFLYTGYESYFTGYIRDLRIINGAAIAPTSIPVDPLTGISGTSLLTCNSHNFFDESSNAFTVNIVGYPKIKAFSPFDSLEYDSTVNGGSYYTDGSGDYATLPTNIFTLDGAYTFETWIYPVGTWFWPLGTWNNGSGQWGFWTIPNDQGVWNGKRTFIYYGNYGSGEGAIGTAAGINRYAWNHVAYVRDGSNNLKIFINGKSQTFDTPFNVGSVSLSASTTLTTAAAPGLGGTASYNGYNGYYAGTRLVTGSALYTTDFTPDLVPPTAVTGTQVLVNATNGGVIDYSSKKNLINLIGNTTSSTTTTKNALSSMYFDGVGDYTTIEYSTTLFDWWSSDYTLEYWFNTPNLATCSYNDGGKLHSTLCSNNAPTTTENYWSFGPNASGQIQLRYWNGASILLNTTATVTTNTWYHIALVVSGTTITIYLNGTASATASISGTPTSGAVGLHSGVGNNSYYQGYIEDLRITKGLARYTANFTPPTEELKG